MGKDIDGRMDEALGAKAPEAAKTKTDRELSMVSLYLTPEIRSHLDRLSEDWGQSRSAVARWVLERGLEAVQSGKTPPLETVTRARLD